MGPVLQRSKAFAPPQHGPGPRSDREVQKEAEIGVVIAAATLPS